MGKYSENDIVAGRKVLDNGAIAGYVVNDQGERVWRIVQSNRQAAAMASAARKNPPKITQEQAKKAFDRFYKNKYVKKNPKKSPKRAKVQDLLRTSTRLTQTTKYKRRPDLYDYPGVDTGRIQPRFSGPGSRPANFRPKMGQAAALKKARNARR